MLQLGGLRDAPEFRRRLAVTAAFLVVFRFGTYVPLPGLNPDALSRLSGTAVERLSIFALGITPFLTILILAELAKTLAPRLRRWEQATPRNRIQLNRIVVGLSLLTASVQAWGLTRGLENVTGRLVNEPGMTFQLITVATLVAATAVVIWISDQITRHGIGSGVWLLLLSGWLASLPYEIARTEWWSPYDGFKVESALGWGLAVVLLAAVVALILAGGRTLATAATCLWSKLLAGWVWPWTIVVIGLIVGGGIFDDATFWLAPAPALHLLQTLLLAAIVVLFVLLYVRSQRLAGSRDISPIPPVVLAGSLAAITFASVELPKYFPAGLTFWGRHVLIAVVALTILDRWWTPQLRSDSDQSSPVK